MQNLILRKFVCYNVRSRYFVRKTVSCESEMTEIQIPTDIQFRDRSSRPHLPLPHLPVVQVQQS